MTLAVGFFDGVHLGHQAILAGADSALTFVNHPLSVLAPARAPALMMSLEDRLAAIRACGVKNVTALEFTPELAAMPTAEFFARHLSGHRIRCGANWHFGQRAVGNSDWLRQQGAEVDVVPFAERDGIEISSTRIREALRAGQLQSANAMLGRAFRVRGERFAGKGEGARIGFPTVNLRLTESTAEIVRQLPLGAYIVSAGGKRSIANFGIAPTFAGRAWTEPVFEVHFPDGLPDAEVQELSLLDFLRPERKFDTVEALQRQIGQDLQAMRAFTPM